MKRQFVNVVVENSKNATFTVHGIRSSSLFHPRKQIIKGRPPPPPTSPSPPVEAELPKPVFTHSLYTSKADGGRITFMPYGSSRDKILSVDHDSNVLVYNICQKKLCSMPRPEEGCSRAHSVAIALGDALYVIDRCPYEPGQTRRSYQQPCFQALIHGEPPAGAFGFPGWYWHTLPPPPYVEAPGYERSSDTKIASSAVVGDSIWVSARGSIGSTYSFSTTSCSWSKVGSWELPFRGPPAEYVPELDRWLGFSRATSCSWSKVGSWELPFRGPPAEYVPELDRWLGFSRATSCSWSKVGSWELPFRGPPAEYVPELDRWLGFSRGRENQFLCASDLSAAAAAAAAAAADGAEPPTLCHVWKEDGRDTDPENWVLLQSDLVRVDSGRFCVARLFQIYDEVYDDPYLKDKFAVLTGVELVRCDTDTGTAADCGIRMVKHKSIRYNVDGKIRLIC